MTGITSINSGKIIKILRWVKQEQSGLIALKPVSVFTFSFEWIEYKKIQEAIFKIMMQKIYVDNHASWKYKCTGE